MKYTETVRFFDKKDIVGVTLNKQYFYCLSYCYLHQFYKHKEEKSNGTAMELAGDKCKTNCTVLNPDARLSSISAVFGMPFRLHGVPILMPATRKDCGFKLEHRHNRGVHLFRATKSDGYAIIEDGEYAIALFRSSGKFSIRAHYYVYNFQHATLDKVTCHEDGGQEYLDSSFKHERPLNMTTVEFPDEAIFGAKSDEVFITLQTLGATDAYQRFFMTEKHLSLRQIEDKLREHPHLMIGAPPEL